MQITPLFFLKKWMLEKAGAISQVWAPCCRNHAGKSASLTGGSVRHRPVTGKFFSTPFPSCTARLVRNSHQVKLFVVHGKNYRQGFSWHLILFPTNTCLQAPFRRGELPNLRRGWQAQAAQATVLFATHTRTRLQTFQWLLLKWKRFTLRERKVCSPIPG